MIVTFYSYKGGVGRTMALSNVAAQLSNLHGYKVLVIDWDLEAPGLHYYFGYDEADLKDRDGLIDLLSSSDLVSGAYDLDQYLHKPRSILNDRLTFGELSILTCGRSGPDYMGRVAGFDWHAFYRKRGFRALERLKEKINERFDICLIDARAGQSEINVSPMSQLADLIVMLFTSSDQALTGTADLARRVHKVHTRKRSAPVPIIFVPSRVFPQEEGYRAWLKSKADPIFSMLTKEGVVQHRHQPKGLRQVTLAVDPAVSFGEQLPILAQEHERSALVAGYRDLVELIFDHKNDEDILWRPDRVRSSGKMNDDLVRSYRTELVDAADRGDEFGAALASIRLARLLREQQRLSEAESLALGALTYLKSRQDRSLQPLVLHTLGQIAATREDYKEAILHYEDALRLLADDKAPRAIILHDLGVAHLGAGDFDRSETMIESSLEIKTVMADLEGQALSLHQLGNVAFTRGNLEQAIDWFNQAAKTSLSTRDAMGAAISHHQLGNVYARMKLWEESLFQFERAANIHEQNGNLTGAGITHRRIGDILQSLGRGQEAVEKYKRALASAHRDRDLRNAQVLHRRLGMMLLKDHRLVEARGELSAALRLSETVEIRSEIVKNLLNLAELALHEGASDEAEELVDRAKSISERSQDDRLEKVIIRWKEKVAEAVKV